MPIITIPVAANTPMFRWELDLFWFGHRYVYGEGEAAARAHAVFINRNEQTSSKVATMDWPITVPHSVCDPIWDSPLFAIVTANHQMALPLNIQIGLQQVLWQFDDEQILEVTDCDMVHFRRCPITEVGPDELLVSTIYEPWHLFSLSSNRHVISPYFENDGHYYNGGFVPIIGRAKTFRRIMYEWIAVHIDIVNRSLDSQIHWWAGMFALQAACEKARVQMIAHDFCYVPGANSISEEHYTGHYSVDKIFNKRSYPEIDLDRFPYNGFYNLVRTWMNQSI